MNRTKSRRGLALAGASAILVISQGPVLAQQGAAAAQADDGVALDEIVVTARRTEEKLLDVPIAVTAFTADDIEERGIRNLDDVAALTPGLTFSNLIGEFLPVPVIRGVAPVNVFGENNAAIFVDGIYVSGREGLNFSQLDLQDISVVKGPQAALYGRNAFSGAINYVTAKPTQELQRKVEVQYGNNNKQLAQVSLSGPFSETVAGRIAFAYDSWDGSYDNRIAGGPDNIGGYEYKTAQASLRFTPSEAFEGLVSVYYSQDEIGPPAMSEVYANCEDRLIGAPSPTQSSKWLNFCGELPTVDSDSLGVMAGADGEERDLVRGHLNLKWTFGGGTLSSLTGFSEVEQSFFEDGTRGTGTATYIYAAMAPTATTPRPVRTFQATLLQVGLGDTTQEISQEIRFTSPEDRKLRWAAGVYYYNTELEGGNDGVIASGLPADFGAFCPCVMITPTLGFPTPGVSIGSNAAITPWFTDPTGGAFPLAIRNDTEAFSGFASVDYDFTDRVTGRAEARWTDESKESTTFNSAGAALRTIEDSWGIPNWRLNLRFKPTEDWTLYGSVASAEKGGDFATGTVTFADNPMQSLTVAQPYDPEKNLSYELGTKARLAGGRVQLEADVYYIDWTDIVIPQIISEVNGRAILTPTAFEINAGDATIQGIELSVTAAVTERLTVNAGASFSDAEFDDAQIQSFSQFPSYAPLGDVSGNKLLRQSDKQFTAGLGYEVPFGDNYRWYIRSDYSYRGEQFADASNQTIVPEQNLLNASLGIRGETWTVELWGRNLLHEDSPTGAFRDIFFTNFAPNLPFAQAGSFFPFRWSVSHPRLTTYSITARVKF